MLLASVGFGASLKRLIYGAPAATTPYGAAVSPRLAYVAVPGGSMPQALKDFPAIDAVIGKQTVFFDFGGFLPPGVTLTGTPTVTITVKLGIDANPQSRLSGGAVVGTVPVAQGGSGIPSVAILQQIAGCPDGVTYVLTASCARSDGTDLAVMWSHLASAAPS